MPGERLPPATPLSPVSPTASSSLDDDELDELPPIDGDGDDSDEGEASPEELDDDTRAGDADDPLDDSTGEDDPLDEELDVADEDGESGWLDDAGDSDGLDVGTIDDLGGGAEEDGAALLEGAEEQDAEEEDLGFGEAEAAGGDSGEEGFTGEDEELREEDLPRLDADDDEEGLESDEPELLETTDEAEIEEVVEEARPVWADRAWERAGGDVRGLATVDALACDGAGVVVGGQGLARIDGAGVVTVLEAAGLRGGALRSIAVDGKCIVVTTPRAGVLVSTDAGASFTEANGWRASVSKDDAASAVDLAAVRGSTEIWGRCKSGALVFSGDCGATWASVAGDARFDAIAADVAEGAVVAFARGDASGSVLARCKAGRADAVRHAAITEGGHARVIAFAAHQGRAAVALAGQGAFVESHAERTEGADGAWTRVDGSASLSALAFGAHGALIVALHSESEARAWIVESRPGGEAEARTVAEIDHAKDEDGDQARVRALAWDERAGVLWAAGGFGIAALRASKK